MRILINSATETEAKLSAAAVERLLRIAFTRYASFLQQVRLDSATKTLLGRRAGYVVRIHARL